MLGWRPSQVLRAWYITRPLRPQRRLFSADSSIQHVRVPCASSGDITVSLHNVDQHDAAAPLVIFIPPFSQAGPEPITRLPSCFQNHPTAVINYRWQAHDEEVDDAPDVSLQWPTPIHDVLFGYSWLSSNLGTTDKDSPGTRSAYVYGSYLGASLGAGLALTESHRPDPSRPMTVRGLIGHNGIYNWTMFLPDHPIHKPKSKPNGKGGRPGLPFSLPPLNTNPEPTEEEGMLTLLKHQLPSLFSDPADLFDPFASACLFFHSANLHIPEDFTTPLSASSPFSPAWTKAIDSLSGATTDKEESSSDSDSESADELLAKAATLAKQSRPPRKGYLVFPPRHSTLRLPETLLLHDRPRVLHSEDSSSPRKRGAAARQRRSKNSFYVQASELAELMMRSLDMVELKRREQSGEDEFADWDARAAEMERRVQMREVEPPAGEAGMELDEKGEKMVAKWLRGRINEEGLWMAREYGGGYGG
ncbi:hypothetical protein VTK56DRAFT_4845 [Thermocarpiscus australiensis]